MKTPILFTHLEKWFKDNREQVLNSPGGKAKVAAADKAIETINSEMVAVTNIKKSKAAVMSKEWLVSIYKEFTA